MGVKETSHTLHDLLVRLSRDLGKANRGNKTASQRVRTATIEFQKIAKQYRKESILFEKSAACKNRAARKKSRRK